MAPTDSNNVKYSSLTSWPTSSSMNRQSESHCLGLRQTRTFRGVHEVLGNICSNDAFAMNLCCRWGLISICHGCSRSLEVSIDIKSRCPYQEASAKDYRFRFTRSYFLKEAPRHLIASPFRLRDMTAGMLLSWSHVDVDILQDLEEVQGGSSLAEICFAYITPY
jgi:hypothetical protein